MQVLKPTRTQTHKRDPRGQWIAQGVREPPLGIMKGSKTPP